MKRIRFSTVTKTPHVLVNELIEVIVLRTASHLLIGLVFAFVSSVPSAWASERQLLQNNVPVAVGTLTPIGATNPTLQLKLAIGLPLRNQDALTALLRDLYDPASPRYHHFLTPQQFAQQFGPSEADYQALTNFANAQGLHVIGTHPNRLILDVGGPIFTIEKVFHITMHDYRHPTEKRMFYAPNAEPSIDSSIPILHVSGLDNYSPPHPNLKVMSASVPHSPLSGSGSGGTYAGNDFRAAYVPGTALTGTGQSVGLVEFDGYYPSDITAYENQFNLTHISLVNVPIDGGVSTPGTANDEVSLDIEMVNAMAPGVSAVYVYEAPNDTGLFDDVLSRMANDNLAKQLSCSWTGGGKDATAETIFKQMASQGQSFFNSSGDSDAYTHTIPFPAESPSITVVGGTTLTTNGAGGSYTSETTWNWGFDSSSSTYVGSSGGVSTHYAIPSYQQAVSMANNQGSTTNRDVPDVALTADNIFITYNNGSTEGVGGTSCAAPLWAGLTALINQRAVANGQSTVGFLNPALYTLCESSNYASNFHDTTTGNNFSSTSPAKFAAATGYDLCTGWGTPIGNALITTLGGPSAKPVITVASNPTAIVGTTFSYQVVASNDPTSYGASGLPAGLGINTTTGLISGTPTAPGGVSNATISATNGAGTASAALTIAVQQAPTITDGPPTTPVLINSSYNFAYTATGFPVPTFSVPSNTLPPGLTLSSAGAVSGTATATGTFTGTITASNGVGTAATQNFSILVQQPPSITDGSGPMTATLGSTYSFTYSTTGFPTPTFSLTSGSLPTGLSLSSAGVVSGTPTAPGTFTGTITASNNAGTTSENFSFTIPSPPVSSDSPAMPPLALVGLAVLLVFTAQRHLKPHPS